MRYFIGFAIRGDVGAWHTSLVKDISEKFDTWKLHEKIPPHVTVFQTFETENPAPVKELLRDWARSRKIRGAIAITGFGRFDDRVVFAKIEPDEAAKNETEDLRGKIKALPGMPIEEFPEWHPHATMMSKVPPETIEKIWEYVSTFEEPHFVLPFNNVTLFRFEGDGKWIAEEVNERTL